MRGRATVSANPSSPARPEQRPSRRSAPVVALALALTMAVLASRRPASLVEHQPAARAASLTTDTTPWPGPSGARLGENVGRGGSAPRASPMALHGGRGCPSTSHAQGLWIGLGHKANILGTYNRVGTGVVRNGNQVYGIQIFYRAC